MSSTDLFLAYQAILNRYVDPVQDGPLVQAATSALRSSLTEDPRLPLPLAPLDLIPAPTNNPTEDWRSFGSAYDGLVQAMPVWARETHPDWVALKAMADSLHDGHTSFLTPSDEQQRSETSFVGIGVVLFAPPSETGPPLISEVFPNSPAAGAGLQRGDRITGVDNQSLEGKSVAEVVQLVRGPANTPVTLQIQRLNQSQPILVTLTRAQVAIEEVEGRLASATGLGYVRIRSFTDDSAAQAVGVLQTGRGRGAKGWILDLRGNGGGSLTAVQTVAGAFMTGSRRTIGFEVARDQSRTPLDADQTPEVFNAPVVILVDHDTASGSEILAAALHEYGVAQIVGEPSSGNVGVATVQNLPDGSAVQITVDRFLSPEGARLDGVGVTPDVSVPLSDADVEAGEDPQLARAAEIVTEAMTHY